MKRRIFFRTMALGTVGLGFQSSIAAVPFVHASTVWQWLAQMRSAFFVKNRASAKFSPENFTRQVALHNAFLEQHGFNAGNTPFCFLGENESFSFYPVMQQQTASGTSEMLLPVFFRDNDGVWSHQKTLNGFQLEALCRAANALSERTESLCHLLMPLSHKADSHALNRFHTIEGSVSITSRVVEGKVQTRCKVMAREGLIFEETFTSRHCLS